MDRNRHARRGPSLIERLNRLDDRVGVSLEVLWERNERRGRPNPAQRMAMASRMQYAVKLAGCVFASTVAMFLMAEFTLISLVVSMLFGLVAGCSVGLAAYLSVGRLRARYEAWQLSEHRPNRTEQEERAQGPRGASGG